MTAVIERWVEQHLEVTERAGPEWMVRCPAHGGTSMRVNVAKGVYYCFGCGARGRVKDLAGGLPAPDSGDLRDRIARLKAPARPTEPHPHRWIEQYDQPHEYWFEDRGFDIGTVQRFGLGWDPASNSVTIGIPAPGGRWWGVIKRSLDPDARPKYRYPKGFKRADYVWGTEYVGDAMVITVCEGSLDAVACSQAGIPAVAILGSQVTEGQGKCLKRLRGHTGRLVAWFDNDSAGHRAVHSLTTRVGRQIEVVTQSRDKDPADLTVHERRQAWNARTSFRSWERSARVDPG